MIITVAHTKGGVGKSTLAWHLTHSLLEIDKSVKLIDLDFQQTLYFVNKIRGTGTLYVAQPKNVSELMSEMHGIDAKKYDYIIIDVGGFDTDINRTAIELSNKALVPISESVTEVLGYKTFESIIDELILDTEFDIVLNNIHPLTKNFSVIKAAVGEKFKLLNTVVRSRKIYKTTLGEGASVFDTKNEVAKNEIRSLRDELINQ